MTGVGKRTGAAPNPGKAWKAINWQKVEAEVERLRMRIAKAWREGKPNKARSLQWLLTHSHNAKLSAVKTVTSNKGGKTPGIDGVVWNTPRRKMTGAILSKRRGYKAEPLRRIEIPKKNGGKRPLGIPTIRDRAMQALYLFSIQSIAESTADSNSYGFRPYRACRDAIGQCFCDLGKRSSPKWILDADIKACFDGIAHEWLLNNIPIDKAVLKQRLNCGFISNKKLHTTDRGTPQGGIISPTLANMTLDGLEMTVRKSCPAGTKVNFVRYADDFICTAAGKELIENNIIPAIEEFLKPRGLILSAEKTGIVNIEEGFDFLSQNIRKYRNKLIIKPSKKGTKSFPEKAKATIEACRGMKCEVLINKLNSQIRGRTNYHRYIQSSAAFSYVDNMIFEELRQWAEHRHPNKTAKWIRNNYFTAVMSG